VAQENQRRNLPTVCLVRYETQNLIRSTFFSWAIFHSMVGILPTMSAPYDATSRVQILAKSHNVDPSTAQVEHDYVQAVDVSVDAGAFLCRRSESQRLGRSTRTWHCPTATSPLCPINRASWTGRWSSSRSTLRSRSRGVQQCCLRAPQARQAEEGAGAVREVSGCLDRTARRAAPERGDDVHQYRNRSAPTG
jgi:hypothetical protein